jgi:hypothetical protein
MRWHDLLFAHWPVEPALIRRLIPPELELDTWEGDAWIGIVPFWMSRVRGRCMPPVPLMSTFPEINLRTYVTAGSKPGVWFFSLDATNPVAVRAARWTFNIPYFDASIDVRVNADNSVDYRSQRVGPTNTAPGFLAHYLPVSEPAEQPRGTLQHWFTERYCLYSSTGPTKLWRIEIDHRPWQLQAAHCQVRTNSMGSPFGLTLPEPCPQLHFAKRQDVTVWLPERV